MTVKAEDGRKVLNWESKAECSRAPGIAVTGYGVRGTGVLHTLDPEGPTSSHCTEVSCLPAVFARAFDLSRGHCISCLPWKIPSRRDSRPYGPTSQPYHETEFDSLEGGAGESMPDDRVTIDLNSESIRSSLLDAFWTFNDVWTLVVDRAIFTPHKAHGVASQYDNAVLEDATRGGASPGNEKHTSPETIWRAYCLVAWSELCVLIARIQDILNGGESWGTHSMKQLSTMLKNVQKWYDALPLELSWNEEDEPTLTPSGYGQLEVQIEYILKFVRRMQEEGIKSVVIGEKAGKDLNDHMDTWHKGSVWAAPCKR